MPILLSRFGDLGLRALEFAIMTVLLCSEIKLSPCVRNKRRWGRCKHDREQALQELWEVCP